VKNAASAARPVTRWRIDEPTVETTIRQDVTRVRSTQEGQVKPERPAAPAGRGGSGPGMVSTVTT
jgi:hypothetical protein